MNVGDTKAALDAALSYDAPEPLKKRLTELWPSYAPSLIKALDARMQDRTKGLQKYLDERADKEVKDMTAILNELERSIREELKSSTPQHYLQLPLWTSAEREQLDIDITRLRKRIEQIPGEIERETEAIRARYREPVPRLFPVAVTYLIPRKIAIEMGGHL